MFSRTVGTMNQYYDILTNLKSAEIYIEVEDVYLLMLCIFIFVDDVYLYLVFFKASLTILFLLHVETLGAFQMLSNFE
jgi:hypothetical protein